MRIHSRGMAMRRGVRGALASAALLVAGRALADTPLRPPPPGVELTYRIAPELSGCPSRPELTTTIAGQLGYDPFVASDANAAHRLLVTIERTTRGTEAAVEWLDRSGRLEGVRHLASESDDCSEVARALAFAIAVQIQLRVSSESPPPAPSSAPVPVTTPAAGVARDASSRLENSNRSVMVGAGAIAARGLTPGSTAGVRVFGSLRRERLSLELSTELMLPADLEFADRTGFSATALSSKLAPCVHVAFAGLCGLGMVGQLSVRGRGVDDVRSPSSFIAGMGGRFELLWPALSSIGLLAHVDALVVLTPRTVLLNQQDVWSTAPISLTAGLDLSAIFR